MYYFSYMHAGITSFVTKKDILGVSADAGFDKVDIGVVIVAIKLLSHSPPFDQRNWFGVIGDPSLLSWHLDSGRTRLHNYELNFNKLCHPSDALTNVNV
jgi:hypothetical protein